MQALTTRCDISSIAWVQ